MIIVRSFCRHQQSIGTSSAEHKPNEWDMDRYVKIVVFIVIYGLVMSCNNKIMYELWWRTVYTPTRVLCWCLFPSLLRKHQTNPGERINNTPLEYNSVNWTKFSEILIAIHTFPFKKMHLKMSSGKRRPSCFGLNLLSSQWLLNLMTVLP